MIELYSLNQTAYEAVLMQLDEMGKAVVIHPTGTGSWWRRTRAHQEELDRYARRVKKAGDAARQAAEEYLQQLRRKLEQSEGLDEIFARHMQERAGKYLCFCANREHMKQMRAKAGEWFAKVDAHPHIYKVYSESTEARAKYDVPMGYVTENSYSLGNWIASLRLR